VTFPQGYRAQQNENPIGKLVWGKPYLCAELSPLQNLALVSGKRFPLQKNHPIGESGFEFKSRLIGSPRLFLYRLTAEISCRAPPVLRWAYRQRDCWRELLFCARMPGSARPCEGSLRSDSSLESSAIPSCPQAIHWLCPSRLPGLQNQWVSTTQHNQHGYYCAPCDKRFVNPNNSPPRPRKVEMPLLPRRRSFSGCPLKRASLPR